jgi:hypothetical protein
MLTLLGLRIIVDQIQDDMRDEMKIKSRYWIEQNALPGGWGRNQTVTKSKLRTEICKTRILGQTSSFHF